MTLGISRIGLAKLGSTLTGGTPISVGPPAPAGGQQISDLLARESPLLQLYKITTKNGQVYRFVDFADPDEQIHPFDLFDASTQQDFKAAGGPLFGWKATNLAKAVKLDANITSPANLYFENTDTEEPAQWINQALDAPFVYKIIDGDFDVWINAEPTLDTFMGILAQGENAPGAWILHGYQLTADANPKRRRIRVNYGATTSVEELDSSGWANDNKWLRMSRRGDDFHVWKLDNIPTSDAARRAGWHDITTPNEFSIPGIGPQVRLGICFSREAATGTESGTSQEFNFYRSQHGLGKVLFRGEVYLAATIGKPKISQSLDGRIPSFNVTVGDPARLILAFAKTNNLTDATIDLDIIHYDDLADTTKARSKKFRLRQAVSAEGPASMTLNIGAPNLLDKIYPVIVSNRANCHNHFPSRHDHASGTNFCSYPSDEFSEQTYQAFLSDVNTETELQYGWKVLNGSKPTFARAPFSAGDSIMKAFLDLANTRFDAALLDGFFIYKKIPDLAKTLDIHAQLSFNSGAGTQFGHSTLFIQDADNLDTWVAFGPGETAVDAVRLFGRRTDDGVTSGVTVLNVFHDQHRILRSGDTWTLYYRDEATDGPDAAWNVGVTYTSLVMGTNLHVGYALFSDDATANEIDGSIAFLRYAVGGFTICNYTESDCTIRENLVQRNAYIGLPDGLLSFF